MGVLAVAKSVALAVVAFLPASSALATGEYELVAHLHQRNLKDFERLFWDIAQPDSPKYLQHQSLDDVASAIGATDEQIDAARAWLVSLGGKPSSVRVSALRDTVTATFDGGDKSAAHLALPMLASQKPEAIEFVGRRDPKEEETSPSDGAKARLGEQDSWGDYTVANIKKAYGMPTDLQAKSEKTLQMVWGPGTFGYSKIQLGMFKLSQCQALNMSKVNFDTDHHGRTGDNYMEGNLDTQMIASFGLNVETLVSNTNSSFSTEEGQGFGQALLDFVTELSGRTVVPHVLSLSLGSLSSASCTKLCDEAVKKGHTLKECQDYLQQQRQVCMFLSDAQTKRISTAFQVLGARGVTIFGSSGDGGSHFSFQKFTGAAMADVLNEVSCEFQMPVFPTASPYIVSVGGEMWSGGSNHPVTWEQMGSGSGSGFSWEFDMPEHQKKSAGAYLASTQNLPPKSSFNSNGRAYPDLSSVGVEGTSQSSPMTAGIFSLIVDQRLSAGLPPLGFLAPRLWKVAEENPGEAFEDITEGNSKTSCDNGFPSGKGWDANTGWGRPVWAGLVKHFASDAQIGDKELVV